MATTKTTELIIKGDINNIIHGEVTKEKMVDIHLNEFAFGLGSGSHETPDGIHVGEGIIYEGEAFAYMPSYKGPLKNDFPSPFFMGIKQKPKEAYEFNEEMSVTDLYRILIQKYKTGFVVTGEVTFVHLDCLFLQVDPIFHENVLENFDKYWHHDHFKNITTKLFGVVLSYLNRFAFYESPKDKQSHNLYSHTHVLMDNGEVHHLLTDSTLKSGKLWVEQV